MSSGRSFCPRLEADLLAGTYRPGEIRRAYIPKAGGGQRGLGIPDVVDRVVCEAVRQVLEPLWEPTFHPSSHGFRPGRSCHTAIAEAKAASARTGTSGWWISIWRSSSICVCHQRLMAKLARASRDRRLLVLIGRLLKAKVVLPDGVVIDNEQGVPQGSPLSPLLSNIVLDELDWELARRGHRFVRYADDGNVYVRSERAGRRVMASLTGFIEGRLRLKINQAKSAVARPEDRHFLGFRLRLDPQTGTVEVLLSERTKRNAMAADPPAHADEPGEARLRAASPGSTRGCAAGIGSSGSPRASESARAARARRPYPASACARSCCTTGNANARSLATSSSSASSAQSAWRQVYSGRKSRWALSHTPRSRPGPAQRFFTERGLISLVELHRDAHQHIVAPDSPQLALWG